MSEKYSYSKIDCYRGCPFKYYLNYEQGNYAFIGSIATEFGTAIHETEEILAKILQAKQKINYVEIKNTLIFKLLEIEKKYPAEYLEKDTKSGRSYKEKALEYLSSGIYRLEEFMAKHPTYEIVGIEQKFNFEYDIDHRFTGAIDRVFRDTFTNKYLIQDIKTYAVPIKEDDLKTPLQFVVYTLAAKELWGCTEEQISCQYDLPLVGITQDGGTKGYMTRGIKKILGLFKGISEKNYEPNPSCLCNYCNFCRTNPDAIEPYKNLCPYYSLWDRDTRNKFEISAHENEWEGLEKHQTIIESFNKKYNIIS